MKLSKAQEKCLLHRHLTGDWPAMRNRGKVIDAILSAGMIEETADGRRVVLSTIGIEYCDKNHLNIATN